MWDSKKKIWKKKEKTNKQTKTNTKTSITQQHSNKLNVNVCTLPIDNKTNIIIINSY